MISIIAQRGLDSSDYNLHKIFNGLLGISIFRPLFRDERIVAEIAKLGSEICKKFIVVLVDYPERWNGILYGRLSLFEAEEYALQASQEKEQKYRVAFEKDKLEIEIWSWYKLLREPKYLKNLDIINSFAKTDKNFRNKLVKQVFDNIKPKIVRTENEIGRKLETTELSNLTNYFLEELAGLFYLYFDLGYRIDIYPGQNPWLIDTIYEGGLPELSKALGYDWSQWGFIQIAYSENG